jgi:hypothetical protein
MYFRTAWSDYFTGSPTVYKTNTYGTRLTPTNANLHILNCLFSSITSTSNGGALYSYKSVTYLLIESTSFFSCKTSSGSYGAIYFYHGSGESVLHGVCGYDCSATTNYQFGSIQVCDSVSSKNYVNYSSIVRCVNENSNSYYILHLSSGKNHCPSNNVSRNKCYCNMMYFYVRQDLNYFLGLYSYSSFTDNIASGYTCLYLWANSNFEIKSCNIIRNTQGNLGSGGTIYTAGRVMIYDSCILENKATYIFNNGAYTTTLSNCTVDSTSNNGYLTIQNTVTKSFILALNHMSTLNCHSEYDSAGYLTPIIQHTPSSTKQIRCYTHDKFFFQFHLKDIISFASILIFNFIHLDSSNNPFY